MTWWQAKVDQSKATIDADQAAIEAAQTQLNYATITAPIDGVVGFRQVDIGNIIHTNDVNPLTVLTQIKPCAVIFTLPQSDLGPVREAMLHGTVSVLAFDQNNKEQLAEGQLLLINNQIDQTTSTIQLKAEFPNEDERLWPGEFVRIRILITTRKDAVTIPPVAVQRGPEGFYVWVIKPDNTVEQRPIEAQNRQRRPGDRDEGSRCRRTRRGRRPIPAGRRARMSTIRTPNPPPKPQAAGGQDLMNILGSLHPPADRDVAVDGARWRWSASWPFRCCRSRRCRRSIFRPSRSRATLPGASPETMGATVATPLERQFGQIAGVTQMSSVSSLGSTVITLQFDLNRNIDGAASDVQAAITAAGPYLPKNLTSRRPIRRSIRPIRRS